MATETVLSRNETADGLYAFTIFGEEPCYEPNAHLIYRPSTGKLRSKAFQEAILAALKQVTLISDYKAQILTAEIGDTVYKRTSYEGPLGPDKYRQGYDEWIPTKKVVTGIFIGKHAMSYTKSVEHANNCEKDFTAGWDACMRAKRAEEIILEVAAAKTKEIREERKRKRLAKKELEAAASPEDWPRSTLAPSRRPW